MTSQLFQVRKINFYENLPDLGDSLLYSVDLFIVLTF